MAREQVIKGFEVCSDVDGNCYDCPYMANGGDPEQCDRQAFKDALALLKEQAPVKPVKSKLSWELGYNWDIWECGYCGSQLWSGANYCDQCGHKVDWDDVKESEA